MQPGEDDYIGDRSGALEARLASADPRRRIALLRAAGREAEALDVAQLLLSAPAVAIDSWRVLMLSADEAVRAGDLADAARLQEHAWRYADSRERQGSTMQHLGLRLAQHGQPDAAASFLELARALRRGFADPMLVQSSAIALAAVREVTGYDAIVLSGGRGSRIGGGKAERRLGDWPLLDHVLVATSGATQRLVVGPARRGLGEPHFVQEVPAGSGPLAGIAAAVPELRRPLVAVLAADLPFVRAALGPLRAALSAAPGAGAAALVDLSGRVNYLAALWRTEALRNALDRLGDPTGQPVRALYSGLYSTSELLQVADFDEAGADVDTPDDLRAAEERLYQSSPELIGLTDESDPDLAGPGATLGDGLSGQRGLPATPLAWPGLALHAPS